MKLRVFANNKEIGTINTDRALFEYEAFYCLGYDLTKTEDCLRAIRNGIDCFERIYNYYLLDTSKIKYKID